jgi:hypothetical protein
MALVLEFRMANAALRSMRMSGGNFKPDRLGTKRHFHIVLPVKIGNNVSRPFQA